MDYKFLGKRICEERSVTLDTPMRLANRLNVTIEYLLEDLVNTYNDMFLKQFRLVTFYVGIYYLDSIKIS